MQIQKLPVKEEEEGFAITDDGADGLRLQIGARNDDVIRLKKVDGNTKIIERFLFPKNDQTRDRLNEQYNSLLQQIIDKYKVDDFLATKQIVIQ